ncbi:hypothetical protein DNTS_012247, partial [Danionella cerebrum]
MMQRRRNTMENPLMCSSQSQQQHGWIQVSDMRDPSGHWMPYGTPCADHAVWNSKFCMLTDYQMLLMDKEEEMRPYSNRSRMLRRTISVPVETAFPEFHTQLSVSEFFNVRHSFSVVGQLLWILNQILSRRVS